MAEKTTATQQEANKETKSKDQTIQPQINGIISPATKTNHNLNTLNPKKMNPKLNPKLTRKLNPPPITKHKKKKKLKITSSPSIPRKSSEENSPISKP